MPYATRLNPHIRAVLARRPWQVASAPLPPGLDPLPAVWDDVAAYYDGFVPLLVEELRAQVAAALEKIELNESVFPVQSVQVRRKLPLEPERIPEDVVEVKLGSAPRASDVVRIFDLVLLSRKRQLRSHDAFFALVTKPAGGGQEPGHDADQVSRSASYLLSLGLDTHDRDDKILLDSFCSETDVWEARVITCLGTTTRILNAIEDKIRPQLLNVLMRSFADGSLYSSLFRSGGPQLDHVASQLAAGISHDLSLHAGQLEPVVAAMGRYAKKLILIQVGSLK
jgi:hypothetical protein